MKKLLWTVSSFAATSYCLIVFLFCLHFLPSKPFQKNEMHCESLILTSTYFLLKYNWRKKTWKVFFGLQSLGTHRGILVSQTAWIRHWQIIIRQVNLSLTVMYSFATCTMLIELYWNEEIQFSTKQSCSPGTLTP